MKTILAAYLMLCIKVFLYIPVYDGNFCIFSMEQFFHGKVIFLLVGLRRKDFVLLILQYLNKYRINM